MPPPEPPLSEQATFGKHLFVQGYPLWNPDPVLVPHSRQRVGLRIGDVGTVDERGRFDVFFNILDSTAEASETGTVIAPIEENDVRCSSDDILPREVVSSPQTSWDVEQLEVETISGITRKITQYSATLSDDGSHVILPQGAQLFELGLEHRQLFEEHAKEHGAEWLKRFQRRLGSPRSSSIYLLTGFYKTCSWSIASFGMKTAANTDPVGVYCTLAEVDERVIRDDSTWHPSGRFNRKIGPAPDRQGQINQTVFIRGITITPNPLEPEPREKQAGLTAALSGPAQFLSTLMGGSTKATTTDTPKSDVTIQHVPHISQACHPSEVINLHLLAKMPSARIAVNHDSRWIAMLETIEGRNLWMLENFERQVDSLVREHYHIAVYKETVYLRDKEHGSPTGSDIDRLHLPGDSTSSITPDTEPHADETVATGQCSAVTPIPIDRVGSLLDSLQAEFCPPLDTSLLAALIADLDPSSTSDQVEALRATLKELASQATAQHEHELADELNLSSPGTAAALPHVTPSRLKCALSEAGENDDGGVDMESVMETLLAEDFSHELKERGFDAPDDSLWNRAEIQKNPAIHTKVTKRKKKAGKTIILGDIRQHRHLQSPLPAAPPAPDLWTRLSSLSEHLTTLIPAQPASFFQKYFHSPEYTSPANALRAALLFITNTNNSPSDTTALFTMLDTLRDAPTYASLDAEQRATLYFDAQLALRATRGCGDDAIDIVWLLLDLEFGTGVSTSTALRQLPSGSPFAQSLPTSKQKDISAPFVAMDKAGPFKWQTVPKTSTKGPHLPTPHIPAYDATNQTRRSAMAGNSASEDEGDEGELKGPDLKQYMTTLKKRNEMLREASKAWNRGNAEARGEVALYFAERARELQELARREALDEARVMVEDKRASGADRNTIDLQGTSISEAVVIIKGILDSEGCSPANPLRIIIGRGTHSASGVSVLKPAVRNVLVRDGWNVGVWDGGLVIRGRTSNS